MKFNIHVNNYSRNYVSDKFFEFEDDNFTTIFYQSGNGDLNLLTTSKEIKDIVIEINKEDTPLLFNIFDEFYNSYDNFKEKFGYIELFHQGYFSWKSDAPANEEDWTSKDNPFIYNYLNIFKTQDSYKLVLINNIKKYDFVIEFNTDRSRYGAMVFPVCKLFKNLIDYNPNMGNNLKSLAKK